MVSTASVLCKSATQVINVTGASSGTFMLSLRGMSKYTVPIAYNAQPSTLQSAYGAYLPINGCYQAGTSVSRSTVTCSFPRAAMLAVHGAARLTSHMVNVQPVLAAGLTA